jgi:hypothetical protein
VAAEPAEIVLDVCTPEGRTWLARITGPDDTFGVARDFVRATERNTSRSGMTGQATYVVGPGVYERREGRRRLAGNNGFFRVTEDGDVVDLPDAKAALAAVQGGA